jgi:hypothetical protein
MTRTNSPGIGRRSLLKWPVAVVVVATTEDDLAGPAYAAAGTADQIIVTPTAAGESAVLVPGPRAAATAPVDLGAVVQGTAGVSPGTTVAFTFDPRLYALLPLPIAITPSGPVGVDVGRAVVDASTGMHTIIVTVRNDIAADTPATVIIGQLKPRTYPLDILRDLGSVDAHAVDRRRGREGRKTLTARPQAARASQAWGADAAVEITLGRDERVR